jgi:hypothetical protein
VRPARRPSSHHPALDDDDPLAGMVNMFDLAIVFAVGLIVALATAIHERRLAPPGPPGPEEIAVADGNRVQRYHASPEKAAGAGRRIGTAYKFPNGEVVYVPDDPIPAGAARMTQ